MNIKRPFLIIIPLLLLILLLFFICSERGAIFKDDSSVSSISDIGGIGYVREISPGEEMGGSTGESPGSGSVTDISAADTEDRSSREVSVRKPSTVTGDGRSVKPVSEKRIIRKKRETISAGNRVSGTENAARKDDSAAQKDRLRDESSESKTAAENKQFADKNKVVSDDKKEIAKSITEKSVASDMQYNRLDRIYLYSGEVLTGAVTARGDIYTIVTPEGIRRVASREIQGNEIVK